MKSKNLTKRKDFKEENISDNNEKEDEKMPYKWVRRWVPGFYYYKKGKRIHVKGHYKWVRIWVPSKRRK